MCCAAADLIRDAPWEYANGLTMIESPAMAVNRDEPPPPEQLPSSEGLARRASGKGSARPLVVICGVELPFADIQVERDTLGPVAAQVIDRRWQPLDDIGGDLELADAILTEGTERFSGSIVRRLARCRVISVYATGTDGIDVDAATGRGIRVTNVPDYCTNEVADHTLLLILAVWRKVCQAQTIARSGIWQHDDLCPMRRLSGRTVGLVGMGRIAQGVAQRVRGFGANVVSYDPYASPDVATQLGIRLCSLSELCAACDVLSVHVPLTSETEGLINQEMMGLIRPGSILVNAGRGRVVDETALVDALLSGRLSGAGLDVFWSEPLRPDHPLLQIDNVVCTPHMGYLSTESIHELRVRGSVNALVTLQGGRPEHLVNPEVAALYP